MKAPDLPAVGRCRCGQLRIEVSAPPIMTAACHCRGCQRMSASAFSLTALMPGDAFRVVDGEPVAPATPLLDDGHVGLPIAADVDRGDPMLALLVTVTAPALGAHPAVDVAVDAVKRGLGFEHRIEVVRAGVALDHHQPRRRLRCFYPVPTSHYTHHHLCHPRIG